MAEQRSVEELTEELAELHDELGELLREQVRIRTELPKVREAVWRTQRRIEIQTGQRVGGRPRGVMTARSVCGRMMEFMVANSSRGWRATELADELGLGLKSARISLNKLFETKRVLRIARGVYQAPSTDPAWVSRRTHEFSDVQADLAAAATVEPETPWTAERVVEMGIARDVKIGHRVLMLLCEKGTLKRLRRGVYVAASSHVERAKPRDPRDSPISPCKPWGLT